MSSLPHLATARSSSQDHSYMDADRRESRLRLGVASVMLLGTFSFIFGSAWDGQWHAAVGRDKFFTPPHLLIYTGVALIALLCLIMVIVETLRYYRHTPGVNDQTTSKVLWLFHAPLGFIITGFGMLMMMMAAPLDNYWHILYGIDVTLWSPFHMMALLSALVALLGMVYLFGSEATRARQRRRRLAETRKSQRYINLEDFLLIAALAILLPMALILAMDDIQFFDLGPLHFAIYPLVAAFCAFILVASVRASGRIGAATIIALIFTLYRLVLNISIIPAVDILAQQQHLFYRATAPNYVVFVHAYPAFLIVTGLLVDGTYWLLSRVRKDHPISATTIAMIAGALAACSVALLETTYWRHDVLSTLFLSTLLASTVLATFIGALWGWLADRFALSVRLLDR